MSSARAVHLADLEAAHKAASGLARAARGERDRAVRAALADGLGVRQVARAMGVSPTTVGRIASRASVPEGL